MGHYLTLTGRTAQRDAELSTEGEGEVETRKGRERHTGVIKKETTLRMGIKFELSKACC